MKFYQKYIQDHPNKTKLAKEVNVSYSFLGALRRGERNPSIVVLERISAVSNKAVSTLLREVHDDQTCQTSS